MTKYLTLEGLEKFKKELNYLKTIKRKEIAERIRDAASQGDLKENAGYDAVKEEQGFIEGRIRELKEIISQAKVIEKKESNKVQIGSFVCLESDEGEKSFQIVGPEEANPAKGKISFESLIGKALLGKKAGDKIQIETLYSKIEGKILKIE